MCEQDINLDTTTLIENVQELADYFLHKIPGEIYEGSAPTNALRLIKKQRARIAELESERNVLENLLKDIVEIASTLLEK